MAWYHQAIIWINVDRVAWHHMASPAQNKLSKTKQITDIGMPQHVNHSSLFEQSMQNLNNSLVLVVVEKLSIRTCIIMRISFYGISLFLQTWCNLLHIHQREFRRTATYLNKSCLKYWINVDKMTLFPLLTEQHTGIQLSMLVTIKTWEYFYTENQYSAEGNILSKTIAWSLRSE